MVQIFYGVVAEPIANRLHGSGGKPLGEENGQTPFRPRTGDVKEVPIALEGGLLVGGNVGVVRCQFEHLVEVIAIPAPTDDNEHILELGALDAVIRLERRMARQVAAQGYDFLVRNSPEVAELLQHSRHVLAGPRVELPQFAFAKFDCIGDHWPANRKQMIHHVADRRAASQLD